jgi:O-antigen ligase
MGSHTDRVTSPATVHIAPARTGARSLLPVLGWAGFCLLVAYAVLVGGGWPGIYLVSLRMLSLLLIAMALGVWLALSWRRPVWAPRTSIWPTLAVPPVVLLLSTIASPLPRLGLEYVAWAVLLVAMYLLLVRILAADFLRERIGPLAAMLGLVVGLAYCATVIARWLEWWDLVGHVAIPPLRPMFASLTLGNPSAVMTVMLLLTVVAVAGIAPTTRPRRITLATLVTLTTAVALLSGSRAGWLAIVGGLAIIAGIWVLVALRKGSHGRMNRGQGMRLGATRATITLAVGGILLAGLLVAPAIVQRLGAGDGGRSAYFAASIRMFQEAPVLGTGPGTWAVLRAAHTAPSELDWYIPHAHDIYLQALAELGIVGVLAGLMALLPVIWLIHTAFTSLAPWSRRWGWAAIFMLAYLGLHQVLDFYANMPAVILLAAIPIAVLDGANDGANVLRLPRVRPVTHGAWTTRLLLWAVCLASVLVLTRTEMIAGTHAEAGDAVYRGDWPAAEVLLKEVMALDPDMPAYDLTLGLIASRTQDWATAKGAFERAASVDDLPASWLGLAQARLELGTDPDAVLTELGRALRLGRQQPAVTFASAALYERLGRDDLADEAYAAAIAAMPSLAGDPWWTDDPRRAARFESIREGAASLAPERAWEIALALGDLPRARTLADGRSLPLAVIDAWEGDPAAAEVLYARADAAFQDAQTLGWAARVADRLGDPSRASRYQRLAVYVVNEGGQLPGTEIGVDASGWLRNVPAGSSMAYAGHYLYRRPVVPDLIPPGLPRLVHVSRPLRGPATPDPTHERP